MYDNVFLRMLRLQRACQLPGQGVDQGVWGGASPREPRGSRGKAHGLCDEPRPSPRTTGSPPQPLRSASGWPALVAVGSPARARHGGQQTTTCRARQDGWRHRVGCSTVW